MFLRNGWLYTGDIAKMDEDGYFYIVDRKKDMVIAGGFNIYPTNIEKVIKEHPEGVGRSGGGHPRSSIAARRSRCGSCPKPGETLTEQEVIDFCKKNLAKFEVPTAVEFRKELPKTMVGKVLRRMLVEEEKKKAQQRQDLVRRSQFAHRLASLRNTQSELARRRGRMRSSGPDLSQAGWRGRRADRAEIESPWRRRPKQ